MPNFTQIQLSTTTLIFFLSSPFICFFYGRAYWYRPKLVQFLDFIFRALVIIAGAMIFVNLAKNGKNLNRNEIEIVILHLMTLGVSILISRRGFQINLPTHHGTAHQEETAIVDRPQIEKLGWDDLIIDNNLKAELQSIVELLRDPKTAQKYGIETPKGILLSGPPGTGKTTVAKVIANQARLSFFNVSLDQVFSKWVGESEKNLSAIFSSAFRNAPSVIFIDEVDAIGKQRSGGESWSENLLNHLLQLIDGVIKRERVYIIAATNRPELVDDALKRAGRLSREIIIPAPDFVARKQLFKLYLSKLKLAETINLDSLAKITEGATGADIAEICNQAGLNAFRRESNTKKRDYTVGESDILLALQNLRK